MNRLFEWQQIMREECTENLVKTNSKFTTTVLWDRNSMVRTILISSVPSQRWQITQADHLCGTWELSQIKQVKVHEFQGGGNVLLWGHQSEQIKEILPYHTLRILRVEKSHIDCHWESSSGFAREIRNWRDTWPGQIWACKEGSRKNYKPRICSQNYC